MSLVFAGGNTDGVDCGSAAMLDNLAAGTFAAGFWLNDTVSSLRILAGKLDSGFTAGPRWYRPGADGTQIRFEVPRSGGSLKIHSAAGTMTGRTGSWQYGAVVWDVAAAAATDLHMYLGDLATIAAEVSYLTRNLGAGTQTDDSANVLCLGNNNAQNFSWPGKIAWFGLWNRVLSLGEIREQQFRPHVTSGCKLFMHLGYAGTGSQPDWSGNGNNGTVTGATVGAHMPLRPAFGARGGWLGAYTAPAAGGLPFFMQTDLLVGQMQALSGGFQ